MLGYSKYSSASLFDAIWFLGFQVDIFRFIMAPNCIFPFFSRVQNTSCIYSMRIIFVISKIMILSERSMLLQVVNDYLTLLLLLSYFQVGNKDNDEDVDPQDDQDLQDDHDDDLENELQDDDFFDVDQLEEFDEDQP